MWSRGEPEDGYESHRTGSSGGGSPGWAPVPEPVWPGRVGGASGRRHSAVSDSGDTGIGTYCSDSVEDDSSSSTTPSSLRALSQNPPGPDEGFGVAPFRIRPSLTFGGLRAPPAPSACGPEPRERRPLRRWSSLTRLSGGERRPSDQPGSLDRGLRHGRRKDPGPCGSDLFLPLSCSSSPGHSLLLRSPGAAPCYWNRRPAADPSSALSSPVRHVGLDPGYPAPLDAGPARVFGLGAARLADSSPGPPQDRDSPIQPAVRTQMWLTEQMEYSAKAEPAGSTGAGACGADGPPPWPGPAPEPPGSQVLSSHSVSALVQMKEGLLRQRELEIDRQKQQILQLQVRIRENELRAQQVLHGQRGWMDQAGFLGSRWEAATEPPRGTAGRHDDLGRRLAVAELEVLHLSEIHRQAAQRYSEDVRRLEDKIRTRDRYISSLKKKCQRESEQNREKQQRIETLEKYLADLPTLDEVQVQALQLQKVQQKAEDLERKASRLQESLEEGGALMKDKDARILAQARRERELVASVHSLQQKVQHCLEDGVRLPVLDLKQLEVENTELLEQQDHSSKMIELQRDQIEKLTSRLKAAGARLQRGRGSAHQAAAPPAGSPQQQQQQLPAEDEEPAGLGSPEVGRLVKEMSLCLLDLRALCSILAQRAQGEELNLSLLLGMKSLNLVEEGDVRVEEELKGKLAEVGRLRGDIEELRRSISDCCAHYLGDGCVSQ